MEDIHARARFVYTGVVNQVRQATARTNPLWSLTIRTLSSELEVQISQSILDEPGIDSTLTCHDCGRTQPELTMDRLPDTEASLREIEYAYSVLKADGIGLVTSYDDKWLGHLDYEPVFEELNRRKAVVFVHPATPLCCRTLLRDVSPILIEIPQDTARAVTNLLFTITILRRNGKTSP